LVGFRDKGSKKAHTDSASQQLPSCAGRQTGGTNDLAATLASAASLTSKERDSRARAKDVQVLGPRYPIRGLTILPL
jgi:hypothetical protein